MDAVHEIPNLITSWPSCNQELLRGLLADFDAKWSSSGMALLPVSISGPTSAGFNLLESSASRPR
jgi:hypothetical protein